MNVGLCLTKAAECWPEKIGLVFEGKRWSFREWNRLSNQIAHAIASLGLVAGCRVAFLTQNRPELLASFFGLLKIGVVPVPVNYRLAAKEIQYILNDSEAPVIIFDEASRGTITGILDGLVFVRKLIFIGECPEGAEFSFTRLVDAAADSEPEIGASLEDTAFLMYTSGTSSQPKGVVRSHRAELFGSMITSLDSGYRHDDILLADKPLYHIAQMQMQVLPFLQIGARSVLSREFRAAQALELIETEKITTVNSVPTQLSMILEQGTQGHDLSSLRIGRVGGGKLPDGLVRKAMELFPDGFYASYGCTEVLGATLGNYGLRPDKVGTVGRAMLSMQVRVLREGAVDPRDTASTGEVGEVAIRGPSLMTEYFKLPEKTAQSLRGGWYFSGDAASVDEDGYFTILGRIDHTIKSGGENIHPTEVEAILFRHPGLASVAVVGIPSRKWSQAVCAVVVRQNQELKAEDLDSYIRGSADLADFKRPRHYVFVDELPANSTGKIDKRALKKQLEALMPHGID